MPKLPEELTDSDLKAVYKKQIRSLAENAHQVYIRGRSAGNVKATVDISVKLDGIVSSVSVVEFFVDGKIRLEKDREDSDKEFLKRVVNAIRRAKFPPSEKGGEYRAVPYSFFGTN